MVCIIINYVVSMVKNVDISPIHRNSTSTYFGGNTDISGYFPIFHFFSKKCQFSAGQRFGQTPEILQFCFPETPTPLFCVGKRNSWPPELPSS